MEQQITLSLGRGREASRKGQGLIICRNLDRKSLPEGEAFGLDLNFMCKSR